MFNVIHDNPTEVDSKMTVDELSCKLYDVELVGQFELKMRQQNITLKLIDMKRKVEHYVMHIWRYGILLLYCNELRKFPSFHVSSSTISF